MALSESERLEALRRSLRPPVDDLSLAARPPPNNLTAQKTSLGDAGQSNTGTAMDRTLLEAAILSSASARQSLLPQSLGLAAAAAAPGAMAGPQLGMGAVPNQFLLSVAAASAGNRNLLDQARAALLSQHLSQQRERLRLQESYQALLQGKLATGGGTTIASLLQNNAPSALAIPPQLVSQAPPSYPSAASMPSSHVAQPSSIVSKTAATRKALETLGSTLRQSSDPYIDVSSVEDPDADEVKIKRTRGGGKFCVCTNLLLLLFVKFLTAVVLVAVTEMFPEILHRALRQLEEEGNSDIASFHSHGRAFAVHDIDRFVAEVMPRFFKQTKWNR